jgi:transcriptional regulator with XRE-family HTH domain
MSSTIANRRRALRLTQNALALELGFSEAMISKIETARTPITPQVADQIEAAFERLAATKRPASASLRTA